MRFIIFAGPDYYPGGGMDDYIGSADSIEEALKLIIESKWHPYDWWQIIEKSSMLIVDQYPPFDRDT